MDEEILWYLGACLLAWSIGWASGGAHRALVKVMEQAAQ